MDRQPHRPPTRRRWPVCSITQPGSSGDARLRIRVGCGPGPPPAARVLLVDRFEEALCAGNANTPAARVRTTWSTCAAPSPAAAGPSRRSRAVGSARPWSYTVGLTSRGKPELMLTGLPTLGAQMLLNTAAMYLLSPSRATR
ncbi:MAG: DUF4262 domain-containing protein [Trebonia sp.]